LFIPKTDWRGTAMPTYHYSCERCEYEFEIDQRITDPPRKRCPKCRGNIYRVIHPVGHILKGSGFYATDYRSEDFKKRELSEKESPTTEKKGSSKEKKKKESGS
jgi:putative FmdB family regulatory protein